MSLVRTSIKHIGNESASGMRSLVVWALKFYRKYLSALNIRCCRFYPSCSEYAIGAVEKHGVLFGGIKSVWRLIRCNPFSRGGYDPVQ